MTGHMTQPNPDELVTERNPVKPTEPPTPGRVPAGTTIPGLASQGEAGSPAALLRRAAELIEQFGLHQGEWWPNACSDPPGKPPQDYIGGDPCCAVGALAVAAGVRHVRSVQRALTELPALAVANDALHAAMPRGTPFVASWNDHPDRVADEVAALMRSAATQLEVVARHGGPSAETFHQAGAAAFPNHQDDSKEHSFA